jgi:molybdopterin molybdotransferase
MARASCPRAVSASVIDEGKVSAMRDVRMRGFDERADVADVERFLAERYAALEAEDVALADCAGRVLAADVSAGVDVPGFARSAMDGYAVRGEDTFGASDYDPIALHCVGEALPGRAYAGTVGRNEAVRIMTGAPVPPGADAVVMAEVCTERDGTVELREAVAPRKNVGAAGEDLRKGEVVLRAGRRLRPQDAGLLASIGVNPVRCVRRPRVRLCVTGDELLPAGQRPEGHRIVDTNSIVLRALLVRDGAELLDFELVPDDAERIRAVLAAPGADAVLVSGGSSVGVEDFAPRLVEELGTLHFHGIAMRPSSPAGVGSIGDTAVFLLPGNPVSCLCAYEFFSGPTLRALGGRSRAWPHPRVRLPLGRKISSMVGRVDYVRVAIERGRVVPLATSGASILSSTVRAAGCVIVPRDGEGMPEGALVEVRLYDDELAEDALP